MKNVTSSTEVVHFFLKDYATFCQRLLSIHTFFQWKRPDFVKDWIALTEALTSASSGANSTF